jgi:N-acetylneuraminic acid mutarotase
MPTARFGLAAVAVNGKIYAIGGRNYGTNTVFNLVEVYDPSTNTWTSASSPNPPAPAPTARTGLGAVAVSGKIYAFGGINNTNTVLNTVEVYDPSTNTWSTTTPAGQPLATMVTARYAFGAATVNGQIYAIGGNVNGVTTNSAEAYNPSTNTWSEVFFPPTSRQNLAAATLNGKIYAVGGDSVGNNPSPNAGTTVEVYDTSSKTWSQAASLLTAHDGTAATDANGFIYVIGGAGVGFNTVEQYQTPVTVYTFIKN